MFHKNRKKGLKKDLYHNNNINNNISNNDNNKKKKKQRKQKTVEGQSRNKVQTANETQWIITGHFHVFHSCGC